MGRNGTVPNRKRLPRIIASCLLTAVLAVGMAGCGSAGTPGGSNGSSGGAPAQGDYGVFLSYEGDLSALAAYETVVIDAQYYTKEQIEAFRKDGHKVYSYINVGALEDFRPYYGEFKDLALGPYEHWEEEVWMDLSAPAWRDFLLDTLASELRAKGIDGFFVDNCDVYYHYPRQDILDGLAAVMKGLRQGDMTVLINGGDTFLDAYCGQGADPLDVATGINQETVFSAIDWDHDRFGTADKEDHAYFTDYIERYAGKGLDIYLLEYTTDKDLTGEIDSYCRERGFRYYVSDSLELDL